MIFKHNMIALLAIALLSPFVSAFCPHPHKSALTQSLVRLQAETLQQQVGRLVPSPVKTLQQQAESAIIPDELIAQDDGLQTPSAEDKARVATIKRNIVQVGTPIDQRIGLKQFLVWLEGLFIRGNRIPFRLFGAVRKATTVEYMALDHVDFAEEVRNGKVEGQGHLGWCV